MKKNFYIGNSEKVFYFWVDPKGIFAFNNLSLIGHISNPPPPTNNPEENFLFIPNPQYKPGMITPYHNHVLKKLRTEYIF